MTVDSLPGPALGSDQGPLTVQGREREDKDRKPERRCNVLDKIDCSRTNNNLKHVSGVDAWYGLHKTKKVQRKSVSVVLNVLFLFSFYLFYISLFAPQ